MYQDIYVRKFINFFMRNGKKETAYKIFYSVLLKIKDITGLPAIKYIKTLFTSTTNTGKDINYDYQFFQIPR